MERSEKIELALSNAWHKQTAEASHERWQGLCEKEGWGDIPDNIDKLIAVFGASWYFTRFAFYRGRKTAEAIDKPSLTSFDNEALKQFLSQSRQADSQETQLEWLRSLKNQAMMQLLNDRLSGETEISENEAALTRLAIVTLDVAMEIAGIDTKNAKEQVAVLGMGRIAGFEMNYGSDLDLIFLFNSEDPEFRTYFSEKVRFLLRHMSIQSATGMLYEIDMRLRPHGTSGALITSVQSFLNYHSGERETWERQMMTRCMAIVDYQELGAQALNSIDEHIYNPAYDDSIVEDILVIRARVEEELARRKGKFDIKRGKGGIMDIDFLTHFLQLKNAHELPVLKTSSTRQALFQLQESGFIAESQYDSLLTAYDFFKNIEACLRLFDMKSISSFPVSMSNDAALVRAMGFRGESAADEFRERYNALTGSVREIFQSVLQAGEISVTTGK